jgi:glycosyltransferase involved in cell wall biosynthesis
MAASEGPGTEPQRADRAGWVANPFVSVVVPVRDGLDALRGCVQALLDQEYPADDYEIIVVDNGSATTPAAVLPADPRVVLLAEPVAGSYRARNTGIAAARGSILAFTDADCEPAADWLQAAVDHLVQHPSTDMIGGRVGITFRQGTPQSPPEWFELVEGFPQARYIATGFAVTANLITRRSVIDRVGRFDPALLSGGDAEWGRRVRAAGGAQRYLPEVVVWHPARSTWAELRHKTTRTTNGVLRRFLAGPHPRAALGRILLGQLYRSALAPGAAWREPGLPSLAARWAYLRARWVVDGVTAATVLRALLAVRPW